MSNIFKAAKSIGKLSQKSVEKSKQVQGKAKGRIVLNENLTDLPKADLAQVRQAQRKAALSQSTKRNYERTKLYSYLDVCINVGQVDRADKLMKAYESNSARAILEIGHYNMLLRGWARLGSLDQLVEAQANMIQKDIKPNAETYAYIMFAYTKSSPSAGRIRAILNDMRSRGIDPRTLFQSAYFNASERQEIRNLIRKVEPAYDDQFMPVPTSCDCRLLERLQETPCEPHDLGITSSPSKLESWTENQRGVEWKSSVKIKSIAKPKESLKQSRKYEKIWQKFLETWKLSLTKAFEESSEALKNQSLTYNKIHLYPYIGSIDKKDIINLMLDEIEKNSSNASFSLPTSFLHVDLGSRVMKVYLRLRAIRDGSHVERLNMYNTYLNEYCTNRELLGRMNPRQFIQQKAAETKNYGIYKDLIGQQAEWPVNILSAIGRFLYGIILREAKFDPHLLQNPDSSSNSDNLVHAFYTAYLQIGNTHKSKEEFRAHKDIEKLCTRACNVRLKFSHNYLPTSVPPMPWLTRNLGGYLTQRSDLVRVASLSGNEGSSRISIVENRKLYPSMDSLNALSICPWIVNKDILDLAIDLFRSGGNYDLAVPFDESKMEASAPVLRENASKADRIVYTKQKAKHDQKKREMYSLWSDCLYRLSIANHFRDRIFWFPHNMDFRGRTYAIPPHFNHLGADLARSLLLFAKGKELGDKGLDWLKIHLINLVGSMKKSTLKERLEYANLILEEEVLDSADRPWDGRRWWTKNENPWQVLACCKEIARAIRSENPQKYICHLAIHQDGSCNGLQHYAALGRDTSGALAVNLVPSERPQDVYSRVVDIVEAKRIKDAEEGNDLAKSLEGFVRRKVIKQTVMTTVYGVTRYGARNQIARQLAAYNFPDELIWPSANYLAAKTFDSITQVFNASRAIQNWLNECASIIASRFLQPVTWETPLGFTVVQPYSAKRSSGTRYLSNMSDNVPIYNDPNSLNINTSKQRTAFPPNYIHSLDSSHMMLTSLHCQRLGITFVSVHDCYWTHPSSVDQMNKVCREQFVQLHQQPLLKQLSEQFVKRYAKYIELDAAKVKTKQAGGVHDIDSENVTRNPATAICESRSTMSKSADDLMVEEDLRQLIALTDGSKLVRAKGTPRLLPKRGENDQVMHSASWADLLNKSSQVNKSRARQSLTRVPKQGDLDLSVVLESTYFFS